MRRLIIKAICWLLAVRYYEPPNPMNWIGVRKQCSNQIAIAVAEELALDKSAEHRIRSLARQKIAVYYRILSE